LIFFLKFDFVDLTHISKLERKHSIDVGVYVIYAYYRGSIVITFYDVDFKIKGGDKIA
jgi:dUTPase